MEIELFHLAMIFVFLTVLLLITTIYSRIWWQLKAVLIVFSVFFYITSYTTVTSLLGRPTKQEIMDNAQIFMFLVEKPRNQSKGRIVLLVRDEKDFRLHEIPFSNKVARMLREKKRESKAGGVPRRMIHKRAPTGNRRDDSNLVNPNLKEYELPDKIE